MENYKKIMPVLTLIATLIAIYVGIEQIKEIRKRKENEPS